MLLHVDGLDKQWENGVQSPYEGELGWHAVGDVENYAPLIFRRVHSGVQGNTRELDLSKNTVNCVYDNGHISNEDLDDVDEEPEINERPRVKIKRVIHMKNNDLRNLLVTSFDKKWSLKKIVWPSRTGKMKS